MIQSMLGWGSSSKTKGYSSPSMVVSLVGSKVGGRGGWLVMNGDTNVPMMVNHVWFVVVHVDVVLVCHMVLKTSSIRSKFILCAAVCLCNRYMIQIHPYQLPYKHNLCVLYIWFLSLFLCLFVYFFNIYPSIPTSIEQLFVFETSEPLWQSLISHPNQSYTNANCTTNTIV